MKLEITSCSRRSFLTSFRTTFTLELFKVLCCCCLNSIPIYCSFSNVWTKNNNNEEKAKHPIFPPEKKKRVSLGIHLVQRPTSTGSEPFSLLISLDATIFVLPIACVAGVRKGRVRELGRETTREGGGRRGSFLPCEPHTLSPAQIPPSPLS